MGLNRKDASPTESASIWNGTKGTLWSRPVETAVGRYGS